MSPQMLRRQWPVLLGLTLGLLLSAAAPAAAEVTLWSSGIGSRPPPASATPTWTHSKQCDWGRCTGSRTSPCVWKGSSPNSKTCPATPTRPPRAGALGTGPT